MGKKDLYLLVYLAQKAGLYGSLDSSTSIIANDLDISQQTASRKLRDFEDSGLIKRDVSVKGISLSFKDKGRDKLKNHYSQLSGLFEKKKNLSGKVFSGLGQGGFYVSTIEYKKEFKKLLNVDPYEGTLNIRANKEDIQEFLANKESVRIEGFETKKRSYGGINCYMVKINGVDGAIIVPDRTNHNNETVEIIAPMFLREKFNLKDNDEVELQ